MGEGFILDRRGYDRMSAAVRDFERRGRKGRQDRRRPRNSGGGSGLQPLLVKSVEVDHLVCHEWDYVTEGTVDLLVALPYLLRKTLFDTLTIDGITYTYDTNIRRTLDDGTFSEDQVITPRYRGAIGGYVGDVIYAARGITRGTGVTVATVPVKLLDMNVDGRAWAREFV